MSGYAKSAGSASNLSRKDYKGTAGIPSVSAKTRRHSSVLKSRSSATDRAPFDVAAPAVAKDATDKKRQVDPLSVLPSNIWLCGNCKISNNTANAPDRCPYCSHYQDYQIGCCFNHGEPYPLVTELFPDFPGYRAFSNKSQSLESHNQLGVSHFEHLEHRGGLNSPSFDDTWYCNECGTDYPGWCTSCPICGCARSAAQAENMVKGGSNLTQSPGYWSPGAWLCAECGCANGSLDDYCAACGANR